LSITKLHEKRLVFPEFSPTAPHFDQPLHSLPRPHSDSIQAYSAIEGGRSEPKSATLLAIAEVLQVPIAELLANQVSFRSLRMRSQKRMKAAGAITQTPRLRPPADPACQLRIGLLRCGRFLRFPTAAASGCCPTLPPQPFAGLGATNHTKA
jgi:transcriptional regulator with XRE-family HTH domain